MAAGAGKLRFTVHSTSGEVRYNLLLPAAMSQHVSEQSGLHRTQTIQLESCCFTALRHGAGRVPGTDPSSFCLDQALLQVYIHYRTSAFTLQILQLPPGGCTAA